MYIGMDKYLSKVAISELTSRAKIPEKIFEHIYKINSIQDFCFSDIQTHRNENHFPNELLIIISKLLM